MSVNGANNKPIFSFESGIARLTHDKLKSLVADFDKYPKSVGSDDLGTYDKIGDKADGGIFGSVNDGTGYSTPQPNELDEMRKAGFPVDEYLKEKSALGYGLSGRGDNWVKGDGINPSNFADWMIAKYDLNKDGAIDSYEALKAKSADKNAPFDTSKIAYLEPKIGQLKKFLDLDTDHDGVLSKNGTNSEFAHLLRSYDENGDGTLSINERAQLRSDYRLYFHTTVTENGKLVEKEMVEVDIDKASQPSFSVKGKPASQVTFKFMMN